MAKWGDWIIFPPNINIKEHFLTLAKQFYAKPKITMFIWGVYIHGVVLKI